LINPLGTIYNPRMKKLILLAAVLSSMACAGGGREIRRVAGCDERLAMPEKRQACRECVERPRPHAYFPDRPEGDRCLPR
jgi:hypothetical protein